jgi:acyl-CoA dehydrogenase
MFVMMNAARLAVGTQGVAIADRAYQQALGYARERRQGRGPKGRAMSPIIEHPDVQRMLMTMKANVHAARGICHLTGVSLDLASHARTDAERTSAANRAALLTPIAKAFSTDIGDEAASIGVQVHGGMGYVEETGAAQHMRDSRIAAIYEGANGIHAIDLVHRKLPLGGGETVKREIAGIREVAGAVADRGGARFGLTAERLFEAVDVLEETTHTMMRWLDRDQNAALAGASQYLRLFGLALGGACLAKAGLAAEALAADWDDESELGRVGLARFFAEKLATAAPGLARAIASGGAPLEHYETILAEPA